MTLARLPLVVTDNSQLSHLSTMESKKSLNKLIGNSSCPMSQSKEELSKGLGANEQ